MQNFVVRMDAAVSVGPFGRSSLARHAARLCLIVSRCGPDGDFLTVAIARTAPCPTEERVEALVPVRTVVGILVDEGSQDVGDSFLLLREQPPGLRIAGRFHPAEGFARLRGRNEELSLALFGRHFQTRHPVRAETGPGFFEAPQAAFLADPAPGTERGLAWRAHALRTPWIGDFVDPDDAPPVGAGRIKDLPVRAAG